MANQPVLLLRLTGEENVQSLNESVSWTPGDKMESTIILNSTDGAKTIDYSLVSSVRTMIFSGNGNFTVTFTVGSSPTDVIAFETRDLFVLSPSAAFVATINSITISTTSTTDITIEARIYGNS